MNNKEKETNSNDKTKICSTCKKPKTLEEFTKSKTSKDRLNYQCKQCGVQYNKIYQKENWQKQQGYNKKNWENNKEKKYQYYLDWKQKYPEKMKGYNKKFKDSDKGKKYNREYRKKEYQEKYNVDIEWTLKLILRNRLKNALINEFKTGQTLEMLGCPIKEFKKHLEYKFLEGMSWENRGEMWEIDHILPCDSFDLTYEEEQKKCFHYTNLQPLFKTTEIAKNFGYNIIGNRNKSNKI